MMLPPLTPKNNMTAALRPYLYNTDLAAATDSSSSHVTTKYTTSSCTLLDNPSPLHVYMKNTSSTRATEDQRRRKVMEGKAWRQGLTSSSGDSGKARLTPSSMSYLEMMIQIPTSMNQWIRYWLVGRSKISIRMVSTATINVNISPHFSSQCMACLGRRLYSHSQIWVNSWQKTWGTHFSCTGMGKRPDYNHGCEIVLLNDPQSSPSQSPIGTGAGLGFRIRPRLGAINCTSE